MSYENAHWKLRILHACRGQQTQMGAVCLAILNHIPPRRPYFKGLANIDAQGVIWALFYARGPENLIPKMVPVCHVKDYNDELRRLADKCKMDDREVSEFFAEARKWIERDARAKSSLN